MNTPEVGTKVGIKYAASACLSCANCLQGGETSCTSESFKLSGYMYPGTFQQYCVSPANYVTPIPAGFPDLAAAAPLMCGGVSVYAALKRAQVKQGDWVVISGAGGGLGHLAVGYARVMGARVIGVDAGEKENFVRELGAEHFLDFTAFGSDAELATKVKEITGGGAQIALVCAATARAYAQGLLWLGFRGKLCILGLPETAQEPALKAHVGTMVLMEQSILGECLLVTARMGRNSLTVCTATKSGNRLEALESVEIAARHGIKSQYKLCKMEELTAVGCDVFLLEHFPELTGLWRIDFREDGGW